MESLRSTGFISPGKCRRVEIGADQAPGWRSLLHLGDQRIFALGELLANRPDEPARRRRRLGPRFDAGKRMRALGSRDLLALVRLDLDQDVGHRRAPAVSCWRPRSD